MTIVIKAQIRRLGAADVQDFREIRLSALKKAPEMFGSVYEHEEKKPMEAFAERLRDAVAFGAYIDGEIIGLSVFKQEDGPKDAHKAHLSGVFVEPEQRGRGVAGMLLRALPAGLLLVMIVRQIPTGIWWMRIFILGALNISLFWSLLFISVYRLPGGVAATVGAVQPLMVVFISAALLGSPIRLMAVLGAICGTAGVALLVLTPNAALDPVGVAAGLAGAVSMAFGTVLTRKWQPPVPLLTFTAWQLAAGGLLLVPVALVFDPPIPMPTGTNVLGLAWLGLIGAGFTYFLWFRGISRLEPTVVSLLGFLSPGTAVLLGWLFLDQTLSALQIIGVLLVIGSIWLGQRSNRTPRARIACRKSP